MLPRRFLTLLLLLALLLTAAPAQARFAAEPAAAPTAQAATFASPLFERVWSRTDLPVAGGSAARSWVWGPRPGPTMQEPYGGGTRTVQYFDKARMEVNPEVKDEASPWAATTGLLVTEMVSGRVQTGPDSFENHPPADIAVAGDNQANGDAPLYSSFRNVASIAGAPDRSAPSSKGATVVATIDRAGNVGQLATSDVQYVAFAPETGHNIPDVFWSFMESHGLIYDGGTYKRDQLFDPVYVAGYPISEAYWATVPVDGQPTQVLIQLYQRRVLTYIPGFNPDWQVQMGNVGQHYYNWRYNSPLPQQDAPPVTAPQPPVAAPSGDVSTFITISGDRFIYSGQEVVLKGTNYWLSESPFAHTWAEWDGPDALRELEKARELGVNTIRIGLPYDHAVTVDVVWGDKRSDRINGWIANQMTQLLQIASVYGMKVMFVLFDWSDSFPEQGSKEWRKQMNYITGIVGPFANDDRVLGWDLHNEPENYGTWKAGSPDKVIDWVHNIAAAVRSVDQKHPITVGMGLYDNLWFAPNGKSILDAVDFVSFHCYDAGAIGAQISAIKEHTTKPILLQEMGWPTGPAELSKPNATYDEATQQFLYQTMLKEASAQRISGVVQWTLWDYASGLSNGYSSPSYEDWFGLVRHDGSFKPAAADFRDMYPARELPSTTATYESLTPHRR